MDDKQNRLKQIFEGWTNLALARLNKLNPQIAELSKERLKICFKCSDRNGNNCGKCGCNLFAKTKCQTCKCPLSKW